MIRIGIIGENYQNDSCAFKAFMTPQYKSLIEFIPILSSLSGGVPPIEKVVRMMPTEIRKRQLNAVLCIFDLDKEAKRTERNKWFKNFQKNVPVESIFFLAVMELEALILADIEKFNEIYAAKGQYSGNPKFQDDPKKELKTRTDTKEKAKRKYDENHAVEIFEQLRFNIVRKKHKGKDSFADFLDQFEDQFMPEDKRLKKI